MQSCDSLATVQVYIILTPVVSGDMIFLVIKLFISACFSFLRDRRHKTHLEYRCCILTSLGQWTTFLYSLFWTAPIPWIDSSSSFILFIFPSPSYTAFTRKNRRIRRACVHVRERERERERDVEKSDEESLWELQVRPEPAQGVRRRSFEQ
jgi:hypothetical protein